MKKTGITILLFLTCFQFFGQPQIIHAPYIQFDIYTIKEGLSNNRINDIFQDSKGYIWIATKNGLNKFDGYNFHIFLNIIEDSSSISGNIISSITEDQFGNLWIGSDQGLDLFNYENNTFTHIYPPEKKQYSTESKFVRAILIDVNGSIWFDSADGILHKYNKISTEQQSFKHELPRQIFTYNYHNLYNDNMGNIWIGGRGMNPCRFNTKTNQFIYYKANPKNALRKRDKDVTKYYKDIEGKFWIAGIDGLYNFNTQTESFNKYIGGSTFDIIDFNQNELWFSNGYGFKILNRKKNILYSVQHSDNNNLSLPSNYVFKFFKDRGGNMWIGTLEGLCKYSPHKNKFKKVFHIYGNEKTLSSNYVTSILQIDDGNIWVGTKNGIDIFDENFLKIDHLDNSKKSTYQLGANSISKLYQDSKGNIFVGLWAGVGFNVINVKKKINKLITLDKSSKKFDWFNDFFEDSKGRLWVGSWGTYGLGIFDNNIYKFVDKPKEPARFLPKLNLPLVNCIQEDLSGKLWVGTTDSGISLYNHKTLDYLRFTGGKKDSTDISDSNVKCIFKDSHNNIWIGTNGLNLYNRKTKTFNLYTTKDGLPENSIQAIIEDDSHNLWIATLNGISMFDVKNRTFTNYFEKDGLSGNEFTGAGTKLKDGRFVLGTKNGLTVFNPDSISTNRYKPIVSITKFKIFEETQDINELHDGLIELKYNRNYLSFEFASSDYSDIENNQFSYMLEGFDNNWQITKNNNNNATYTYLEPGEYKFLLKAANSDGVWNEKIKKLLIIISPPFWKTWWFISLEVFFVLLLIFVLVKYREKKLKDKHFTELLEQRLLRSQMNPHFIFNALIAIQSYIFSHNPIEAATYLAKFADLMRSILYGSREEYVSLDKEIKTLENYLLIQQLRFEEKFDYHFEIEDKINSDFASVPPMLIQPFIENSIEHGFKNLDRKGLITIKILEEDKKLKFIIEDNGIGIKNGFNSINNEKDYPNIQNEFNQESTTVEVKKRWKNNKKSIKYLKPLKEKNTNKAHKSLAITIIKERLRILNNKKNIKYTLNIGNRLNQKGEIEGTRVVLYLPLK